MKGSSLPSPILGATFPIFGKESLFAREWWVFEITSSHLFKIGHVAMTCPIFCVSMYTGVAMSGKLVILSGPSGVGKDTIIDAWKAQNPRVHRVVAYTTRAPRIGEEDGRDYHFVTVEAFQSMAEQGDFLEFKEVHGNWYATPLKNMDELLKQGQIAILKIDVQGALHAMNLRRDATTVFILPPSMEELESRIRGRGADDHAVIEKRLKNAQDELAVASKYQHRIVNVDVEMTVDMLERIFA